MTLFVDPIYNPALKPSMGTGEGTVIFGDLISRILTMALYGGVLVCFMYLIWGGFQWITSGGDKQTVETARQKITQAVIGLTVLACTWVIIVLIGKFLGIQLFGGPIKLPIPE